MFDRKLLLGLGLAILLAITPVAFAQSGQSGTSSDPANQQGAVGSSQSQSSMAEQGNVDWTDARYSKDEVRLVQEALKSRGMDPGPIDGIKGSKTKQALREFQKQNNLTVVGDINNDTLRALGVWDGPLSGSRATGQASTGTSTEGSQTSSSQSSSTSDTGTIDPSTGQTRSEDSTSSQPGTDTTTAPDTTPAPDTTTTQPDTTTAPDTTTTQPDTTTAPDTTTTQPDTTTAPDTTTTPPGTDSTTAPDSSTTQSDTTGQTTSQGSQTGMVGQPGASAEQPGTGDHSEVVRSATEVFRQFSQSNASSSTMRDAKAIAIIPVGSSSMGAGAHGGMGAGAHSSTSTQSSAGSMGTQGSTSTQGSMGMSAQSGKGLIVRKNTDGSWSRTPAFIRMSGGSTELQSSTSGGDLVFLFSDENSINSLMDGSLDLATEVTVQAGPSGPMGATGSTGTTGTTGTMGTTGSTGTAGSTGTMGSTGTTGTQDTTSSTTQTGRGVVYAYSRSAGSYSGTSVTSGTITIDDSANQSAYGRQLSARDLLSSDATQSQVQASSTLQPFIDAISSQAPSRAE